MKIKLKSVIVNVVLCLIIVSVCFVGFSGSSAKQVNSDGEGVYYRATDPQGVSLMFNVYESAENVREILQILSAYSAKATFFIGGCWADDNVDCVKEISESSHEIATHGYFHKDHSKLNYSQNVKEIEPSVQLLEKITGKTVSLFAPPSGAYSSATVTAAQSLNLKTVMWSRDTIDWRDSDQSLIYTRATKNLESGEFILMHPKDVTVQTLPKILAYLRQNNLSAVTVSENLN